MKALFFILLFMSICYGSTDECGPVLMGDIYIYEYAIKKPNQAYVGFIVMNDGLMTRNACFTVSFMKDGLRNVTKQEMPLSGRCSIRENGNVFIESNRLLCYSSKNFNARNKLISDNIYKIISSDFNNMTNSERLKTLERLVAETADRNQQPKVSD